MLRYSQTTGVLSWPQADGVILGLGFAGNGGCMNNPEAQCIVGHGPLPQGHYKLTRMADDPHMGPDVIYLEPFINNEMFGRSAFRIHGANAHDPAASSDGCIVLSHEERRAVWNTNDRTLEVIP